MHATLQSEPPPPSRRPSNVPTLVPNPIQQLLRLELPEELDEALGRAGLHGFFARLSSLQQCCYADWVGDSPFVEVRSERANMVCRVVRQLH